MKHIDSEDTNSVRRGIEPKTRLVLLFCTSTLAVLIDNIALLAGLYVAALALFAYSRAGLKKSLILLAVSAAAVWGFIATQSFFYPYRPRTMLLQLVSADFPILGPLTGGVSIYLEGVLYGLAQSLRFLVMLTAGFTVVWTTSPQQLLRGLRKLRIPYKAAFLVATAVRFIPAIASEAGAVMAAMKARGFPLRPSRPWNYFRALGKGLTPIIYRNVRRASMLADSLESRGFSERTQNETTLNRDPVERILFDRVVLFAFIVVTISLAVAKLLNFAAGSGIFYSENMRWLYVLVDSYF